MDKIRVTVVVEYEPEPGSYTYPEGVEDLTLDEMARQDEELFTSGIVGVEDILDWSETITVKFEVVR